MTYRTRILQIGLTMWALLLLASSAYVFARPQRALERWLTFQAEAVERGGGERAMAIEHTGVTSMGVDMFASALIGSALALLVLALLWRAAHLPEARILAVFLAVLQIPGIVLSAVGIPNSAQMIAGAALMYLAVGAFLRFAAVFPRPLRADELGAKRAWVRRLQRLCLNPTVVWGTAAVLGGLTVVAALGRGPLSGFISMAGFLPILLGVSLLRRSYTLATADDRRRLLWVVQGFYTAVWVLGLGFTAGMVLAVRDGIRAGMTGTGAISGAALLTMNLTVALALLIILCSLAFAIFYHGAIEPGLVIQKTTIYGILTVAGAATFGLVENLASDVILQALHLPESWGGPIAGAVVAGAVTLLRPSIGGWVSRRFPAVAEVRAA